MHTGRESRLHARYFLTFCVRNRQPVLTEPAVAEAIRAELHTLAETGDIRVLEWVIMPDHLHLLFELGDRLSLGRVAARFKTRTRGPLADLGAEWQRDYYEHRLRPDETADAYAAYIFLNPYRAGLIAPGLAWPHGGTGDIVWGFRQNLGTGLVAERPAGFA